VGSAGAVAASNRPDPEQIAADRERFGAPLASPDEDAQGIVFDANDEAP
jgi:hypothetical protein